MKRVFLIFGILISITAFSQETVLSTAELSELDVTKKSKQLTIVEKPAEFSKGNDKLRQLITKNFRERKVIGQGVETCSLTFIVERDGSIRDIKASGSNTSFNLEAINALSKVKDKWIPAEINGEKVRYRFKIPLTLRFK